MNTVIKGIFWSINYNNKKLQPSWNHFNVLKLKNCKANDTGISNANVNIQQATLTQATYMQILKILVFSIISGKQSDMSETTIWNEN